MFSQIGLSELFEKSLPFRTPSKGTFRARDNFAREISNKGTPCFAFTCSFQFRFLK